MSRWKNIWQKLEDECNDILVLRQDELCDLSLVATETLSPSMPLYFSALYVPKELCEGNWLKLTNLI